MEINDFNINWDNNDMIDKIEEYIDDIIFSDDLKLLVKSEIIKLRKEINNKNINWTQNEQEEFKKLIILIFQDEKISNKEKLKLLINIMNKKINNELLELDINNFKSSKELITIVKKNNLIKKYWKITDKYIWKSKYLIIIFPVVHRNMNNKDIYDIADISLKILVNQNNNLLLIINELIKNWISSVYSFEWFEMIEISKNLPGWIEKNDINAIKEYEELLKNPKENNEKIKKYEKLFSYMWFYLINPEIKFDDKLLSYWIENKNNINILLDLNDFLDYIAKLWDIDYINNIKKYLNNKKILNNKYYFDLFESILFPENINSINFEQYLLYIKKVYYYYKFTKRNEDVVKNIEKLYDNTRTNWIMLQFWSDHFENEKNIKEGLKEKWISFIEITPFTEKK